MRVSGPAVADGGLWGDERTVLARVIQITDCHVMTDPLGAIRGVPTRGTLERVLSAVERNFPDADRLIITGDLTHDEKLSTYVWLRERLQPWITRLRVIPGNHDDRGLMREVFGDRLSPVAFDRNVFIDEILGWRLIGLDSHVPGKLHGELGLSQLSWLRAELEQYPHMPTCLCLHHPPVLVGSAWLDRINLLDAAELLEIVRAFPQVRSVWCGHVHQERTMLDGNVLLLTTPSTGVQFRPETKALEVADAPPGFRVIELVSAGRFQTRVEHVVSR